MSSGIPHPINLDQYKEGMEYCTTDSFQRFAVT